MPGFLLCSIPAQGCRPHFKVRTLRLGLRLLRRTAELDAEAHFPWPLVERRREAPWTGAWRAQCAGSERRPPWVRLAGVGGVWRDCQAGLLGLVPQAVRGVWGFELAGSRAGAAGREEDGREMRQ